MAGPLVGVLDFEESPDYYVDLLAPSQVKCFTLEKTSRFAVVPVRDEPLPEDLSQVAVALIWHLIRVPKELIDAMPALQLIVRMGAGYDSVDLEHCGRKGIPVCNIPDYGTEEVADTAMSHILNLLRCTTRQLMNVRQGLYDARSAGAQRVRGKVLGLLGFGRIGKAVSGRAKPFGFDVVFYDPHRPDGEDKALGVRRADTLEELLAQADVLSIHCDLNLATHHMIDAKTVRWLKQGSYIVNTARGAIIQTQALVDALQCGHLTAAGMDVLEAEPCPPALLEVPGLEITPHCAFYSQQGWDEMRTKAALEAKRLLEGNPLRNVVNLQHLQGGSR